MQKVGYVSFVAGGVPSEAPPGLTFGPQKIQGESLDVVSNFGRSVNAVSEGV